MFECCCGLRDFEGQGKQSEGTCYRKGASHARSLPGSACACCAAICRLYLGGRHGAHAVHAAPCAGVPSEASQARAAGSRLPLDGHWLQVLRLAPLLGAPRIPRLANPGPP